MSSRSMMRNGLSSVRQLSSDDVLSALGLQRRRELVAPNQNASQAALFIAGAFVGAAVALLLSPKSGENLRQDLQSGAKELGQRIGAKAQAVQNFVSSGRNAQPNGATSLPQSTT